MSLPAPDLTLFFDISPDKAKERGGYGAERYEKEDIQRRVRAIFRQLGDEMPKDGTGRWVVIDAGQELDTVARDVWREVEGVVGEMRGPVGKLWQGRT